MKGNSMKALRFFFTFIFLIGINGTIFSQDADEVVNKHIKAIGGLEKIQALKTLKFTGKFSAGGMDVTFTQTFKRPLMSLMEATIQGMTMKQAFDGTQGWMINPFTGKKDPDLMPKDQEKAFKKNSDFEGQLVNYKEKGSTIELIGKEDFEGTQVFNLKLTDKEGDITNYYFDAETFLIVKQADKMKFESKDVNTVSLLSDYKSVEGVMMPFSMEVNMSESPMGSQKITIEKWEANIPIDDSIFKMPAKN